MFYLSQPIAGLLLLTSQLFSGRDTFTVHRLWADVFQIPPHRQCENVGGKQRTVQNNRPKGHRRWVAVYFYADRTYSAFQVNICK